MVRLSDFSRPFVPWDLQTREDREKPPLPTSYARLVDFVRWLANRRDLAALQTLDADALADALRAWYDEGRG